MRVTGPDQPRATVLLAHGAGAPMDSDGMNAIAEALAAREVRVLRFEFAYMAGRRAGGPRRPPPRAEALVEEYRAALDAVPDGGGPLVIGGKSMGGRVASLLADEAFAAGRIAGLVCIGYPFHPVGKPERLRTAHLETLRTPTLICQGTRDAFGSRAEVAGYALSEAIDLRWFEDGDHDLKPRKRVTGRSHADHLAQMAAAVADWIDGRAAR
jgi:predicted alpha/beta-hydrolase family hydrolase